MMTPKKLFATRERVWDAAKVGEWLDCKYYDDTVGEVFFVELQKQENETMEQFIARCTAIARDNFDRPICCGLVTNETAEMLGYDTY